jgi:uncharacterized protein (TIGR02996 family)
MSGATLPEPLRADLTIQRDLPEEEVIGFLGDLWREPEGPDVGLMFADWLEDHGDARSQPVRWSLLRENAYTEAVRTAYRERITEWWLRHGRAWVGPVARNIPLVWYRGCLTARIEVNAGGGESPVETSHRIRSLRQAPWVARVELSHAHRASILFDFGSYLRALVLRACTIHDFAALELLGTLRHLTLEAYPGTRLELRGHRELEVLEIHGPGPLQLFLLDNLPRLNRLDLRDCQAIEEMRLEHGSRLKALNLSEVIALRWLTLIDLPRLERLEVSRLGLSELILEYCPRLPADEVAAIRRTRRA